MSPDEYQVIKARNPLEFREVYRIREVVFIDEQNVPRHLEIENEEAEYFLLIKDGRTLATGRYRDLGTYYKVERMAVLKESRGQGIGRVLLKHMMEEIPRDKTTILHAQTHAKEFYEKCGFIASGDVFYEADIPHYKMTFQGS